MSEMTSKNISSNNSDSGTDPVTGIEPSKISGGGTGTKADLTKSQY